MGMFRCHLLTRRSLPALVAYFNITLCSLYVISSFNSWIVFHRQMKHRKSLLRGLVSRWMNRVVALAFLRWHHNILALKSHKVSLFRILGHWANRQLGRAFGQWLQLSRRHCNERARHHLLLQFTARRFLGRRTVACLQRWLAVVDLRRRHELFIRSALSRGCCQLKRSVFNTWVQAWSLSRHSVIQSYRIRTRMMRRQCRLVFAGWASCARSASWRRHLVLRHLRAAHSRTVSWCFRRWARRSMLRNHSLLLRLDHSRR